MAGHQRTADTPAGGGQADGRTPRRAEDGGGALCYGWEYMLTLWGKGGYGGSPNVEAGKMYQHAPVPGQRPGTWNPMLHRCRCCIILPWPLLWPGFARAPQLQQHCVIAASRGWVGLIWPKSVIAATTPIATAFKFCVGSPL
jgi:hypothetical protein